jgi:hypothetical protein
MCGSPVPLARAKQVEDRSGVEAIPAAVVADREVIGTLSAEGLVAQAAEVDTVADIHAEGFADPDHGLDQPAFEDERIHP